MVGFHEGRQRLFTTGIKVQDENWTFLNYMAPKRKSVAAEDLVIKFVHLTPHMLALYERWMLKYGKAAKSKKGKATGALLTTVGIYGRHIRSVFNDAIEKGIVNRDLYPFSKNHYTIPAGSNTKKGANERRSVKDHGLPVCAWRGATKPRPLVNDICRLKWRIFSLTS